MSFLLEPHLPWSAEDAVIDYEVLGTNRAFMVAAQAEPLAEFIDAFEERGITVASLAPLARLALDHHLKVTSGVGPRYALLWRDEETVDLWLIENNRPAAWRWLPYEPDAVACDLAQIALCEGEPLPIIARNLPGDFLQTVAGAAGLECRELPSSESDDPIVAGALTGALVLEGRSEAPIELRRDHLAAKDRHRSIRTQLRLLQGSVLLLLVILGIALFVQSQRFDAWRQDSDRRQTALFRRLFPEQHVPVAVGSRLESELARLNGVRGERPDLPEPTPFLMVLERLLKALPADLRFRLLELRVENGQLYVVGQVRAHGDADRIADALRHVGLEVPPPNTHRLEREGVEFRISARLMQQDGKKSVRKPT